MSERASAGWPIACSGDMYGAVPSTDAVWVSVDAVRRAGDPEVEHLDLPLGRDHDVAGLDVAVDDSGRMSGGQRAGHLLGDADGTWRLERALIAQDRGEVSALDILHHDVARGSVGAGVEHGHDARIADPRGRTRLALEP